MGTITVKNKTLMDMIHKAYPAGVKYASEVMSYAVDLSDNLEGIYSDSLLNNYGMYPFLDVESVDYEEGNLYSMHVVISSKFDIDLYMEWVDELSLSNKEKEGLKNDIRGSYTCNGDLLDSIYLSVLKYTISYLKCMKDRRKERKNRLDEALRLELNYSTVVNFNEIFTLEYLCRKIRKLNSKRERTGKHFLILEYPSLPKNKVIILSCVPYRLK